jgi:hypothetical protein
LLLDPLDQVEIVIRQLVMVDTPVESVTRAVMVVDPGEFDAIPVTVPPGPPARPREGFELERKVMV